MSKIDYSGLKSTDKIKIKKMHQAGFGVIWPVYEVRLVRDRKSYLLCKCEAEDTSDQETGLKKAELIRNALLEEKNENSRFF